MQWCPWVPRVGWYPPAVPAEGMIVEILLSWNFCVLGARKSSVIMLLTCQDSDETGNQRGWISAKGPQKINTQTSVSAEIVVFSHLACGAARSLRHRGVVDQSDRRRSSDRIAHQSQPEPEPTCYFATRAKFLAFCAVCAERSRSR